MIKAIALVKRKSGLSHEEFQRHYEEVHAPLAMKYLLTIKRYVRNYVIAPGGAREPEFDCVTEFWYENMGGLQAARDLLRSEAGRVIREDEESFIDRSKVVSFLVEEKATIKE